MDLTLSTPKQSLLIATSILLALGLMSEATLAQRPESSVEVGASYSDLDNNFEDWHKQFVRLSLPTGLRSGFFGEVSRTDWFTETDAELSGGLYGPLTEDLSGRWNVAYSPTHEVAPEIYSRGQLDYWLANGWELQAGAQFSDYDQGEDSTGLLGGVRYYQYPYWFGYTYVPSWLGGDGPADSHTFSAGYTGDNNSSAGLSATVGESNIEGGAGQVQQRDVTSLSAWGEQPLTSDLSLTVQTTWDDIDNLYDRTSVQAGVAAYF